MSETDEFDEPYVMLCGNDEDPRTIDLNVRLNEIGVIPSVYESLIEARWIRDMRFCGCGIPEEVQEYMRTVLQAIADRSDQDRWCDDVDSVRAAVGAESDALHYFVMYVLDAMRLTEHGGGVGGSWLTDAGRQMLKELTHDA